MRKVTLAVAGAFVVGMVFVSTVAITPAYAEKEALWEETFDAMEEGEETGMGSFGCDVNQEVQGKLANGGKGKALKVTAKEGATLNQWKMFGLSKDMTFPNENAILSFSYYASGVGGLSVMTNNRTLQENCDSSVSGLVQGKWTKVVLRISKFKVKSPKGTIKTGDEFRYLHIFSTVDAAKPFADQFFVLDDIKLTIGEDEKGAAPEKEEKKK